MTKKDIIFFIFCCVLIIGYFTFTALVIDPRWKALEETVTEPCVEFDTTEPVAEVEPVTQVITSEPEPVYRVPVTYEELVLLVNVVMAESGNQCLEGQIAVAETVINRVLSNKFPNIITEVVYAEKQYCTVFKYEPTDSCWGAVWTALTTQSYPSNMYYFRTKRYHSFGTPYRQIQDHYFSLGE